MGKPVKDAGLKYPRTGIKQKNTRKGKLKISTVQREFNCAIRRRECNCVMTHSEHRGKLESSHFFSVGANTAMRFYPPNAHTQCTNHHNAEFHNDNPIPYYLWMIDNVPEMDWMERNRKATVKYTQDRLEAILAFCRSDDLDELQTFIEGLIND